MTDNATLTARKHAAVARAAAASACEGLFAERAENAELWDADGRRYVDFAGGIAVLNTGHRHPDVVAAVEAQLAKLTHTAFGVMPYEPYVTLAEKLNALAPGDFQKKSLFVTTGAEAVENAIKCARAYTGRSAVIAFDGAFHGRTLLTMGLTGKMAPYKHKFGPFPGDIFRAPFPMAAHGVSVADSLKAVKTIFKTDADPTDVAAIIVEPVQGEGGFYAAPTEFLVALREICDAHGIVLIADEVQSGFGRTGRMFAMEHSGVAPDVITVAKSLAGGFPLAGVVGRAEIMDAAGPGGLGGTYAGNPLSCAAALAVIEVIENERLLARAETMGKHLIARIETMKARDDVAGIGEVRGLGAMVAFELVKPGSGEPDAEATKRLLAIAHSKGLVLLACGFFGNVIRILVPLTASDAIVDEGLDIIEVSLVELAAQAEAA